MEEMNFTLAGAPEKRQMLLKSAVRSDTFHSVRTQAYLAKGVTQESVTVGREMKLLLKSTVLKSY